MSQERKIITIPPKFKISSLFKRVAIYCRVSTNHTAQEESLKAQIDRYQKMVEARFDWKLVKTYSDTASGRNTTGRTEFMDLMDDCKAGKIDLIVTKSISRFGRNTVDIISNIRQLKKYNVDVFFEVENIHTSDNSSELILSMISAVAQEDSASKSNNIRIGIEYQLNNGTSHLYSRPCYGYKKGANGKLIIDEKQAKNVGWIFDLYLQGHSVLSIIRELKKRRIKSPSGNTVWSKRAIETLLANEKYVGDIIVGKTFRHEFPSNKRRVNNGERKMYETKNSHQPIIQREVFDKVQQERKARSNIGIDEGKAVRKNTRYSMKSLVVEKVA
ncbi:MAG: recombinase family protein [Candidatus Saccharibacteria bacterium]